MKHKQFRRWSKTIKKWKQQNPPDFHGYWYCIIGGKALTDEQERLAYGALPLTLDHNIPRSRAAVLRHYIPNLNPMCTYHNNDKGSRSLDEYKLTKPSKRCLY